MVGSSYGSILQPIADILSRAVPKGIVLRFPDRKEKIRGQDAWRALSLFMRSIELHEFAHFFSFRMWHKQPPDTLDPFLRELISEK